MNNFFTFVETHTFGIFLFTFVCVVLAVLNVVLGMISSSVSEGRLKMVFLIHFFLGIGYGLGFGLTLLGLGINLFHYLNK